MSARKTPGRVAGDFAQAAATKPVRKREAPFSLRLSLEERAWLKRKAGGKPLGTYIRACIFAAAEDGASPPGGKAALRRELAEVLAALGASCLSASLADIATAARLGTLPLSPETVQTIETACADIAAMRQALIEALGLTPEATR